MREKNGDRRNPTTPQTTFFQLCVMIRTIVAPNATAIIEMESIIDSCPVGVSVDSCPAGASSLR